MFTVKTYLFPDETLHFSTGCLKWIPVLQYKKEAELMLDVARTYLNSVTPTNETNEAPVAAQSPAIEAS